MQNGKVFPGILIALILASGAGWWYWNHAKATPQATADVNRGNDGRKIRGGGAEGNRPVPVLVASVQKGDIRVVQTAVGTVIPSATVTVSSQVSGKLVRVLFKEGQLVRAKEVLAEIDPRPFQATLTQVQGQALRDQALLRNGQIDLERYKALQKQDSIASQQVDAQASLVQQFEGTVQADQGVVDNARLQLGYTSITAPISGRIGLRQIDVGNNITPASALAVVNTVDPIQVVFTLPEDRVPALLKRLQEVRKSAHGLPVEAWDRANTSLLAKGNLLSLDNQIDTSSGTVRIKAQFSNEDSTLFPNQFVNVRLLSDVLKDATTVASASIQHGSAGAYVYLLNQEEKGLRVHVQPVRLGTVDGDNVTVLEGLKPGDQVVISGIDKLRENAKVTIASPEGKEGRGGKGGRRGKHGDAGAGGDPAGSPRAATSQSTRGPADEPKVTDATPAADAPAGDGAGRRRGAGRPSDPAATRPEGGWKHRAADDSGTGRAASTGQ